MFVSVGFLSNHESPLRGKHFVTTKIFNGIRQILNNEKKTINVVTGSVVLFPASLMHYTIPFESEEERIVLAFDMREKL